MLRNEAAVARLATVLCTGLRVKKRSGGGFEMQDFMPYLRETVEATPENEMELIMREFGVH
jgi:hypothetical protein